MNMSIALQRPPYKGKLNFDEETYLGVIAFGNALGNSIVRGIKSYEYNKNVELNNKLAGYSQQLTKDAYKNIKNTGALDLNLDLENNQQLQNNLNNIIPKEKAVKELAGLGGIDVGAANARNAGYRADLAIKTQQGQQTQFRVNELVAETQQLLGNNTDVGLYGNSSAYGVPSLLARPNAGLVNLPRQTINQTSSSWLDQINTNWSVWEKSNPLLSEIFGRQSLPGTLRNISAGGSGALSSFKGLSYVNSKAGFGSFGYQSDLLSSLKAPNGRGFAYTSIDLTAGKNGQPMLRMDYAANNAKGYEQLWKASNALTHLPTNLVKSAATGGLWGIPLSVAGTTFQYAMDDTKSFASTGFAKDVGLDLGKGVTSGAIGAVAGVGASIALSASVGALGGSVVPVVGTAIGFVAGTAVGIYSAYKVEDVYKYFGWR